MLVAVCVRSDRTWSCTSMFNVAMSNTSYPKVSNNTFFSYHCVRTRSGAHKASYLAGDEDLTFQRVKQSEPKTDYLAPCNYDIQKPWSYTSIPTHRFWHGQYERGKLYS